MADKVKDSDVLRVLAKHASQPTDPDDAATLARWNEQQAEQESGDQEPEEKKPSTVRR